MHVRAQGSSAFFFEISCLPRVLPFPCLALICSHVHVYTLYTHSLEFLIDLPLGSDHVVPGGGHGDSGTTYPPLVSWLGWPAGDEMTS